MTTQLAEGAITSTRQVANDSFLGFREDYQSEHHSAKVNSNKKSVSRVWSSKRAGEECRELTDAVSTPRALKIRRPGSNPDEAI